MPDNGSNCSCSEDGEERLETVLEIFPGRRRFLQGVLIGVIGTSFTVGILYGLWWAGWLVWGWL